MQDEPRTPTRERAPRSGRTVALAIVGVAVLVWAGLLALVGLSGDDEAQSAGTTTAAATRTTQPEPDSARVPRIQGAAERLRAAAIGAPVVVENVERAALPALIDRLQSDNAPDAKLVAATDDALHLMGVLTPDQDYEKIVEGGLSGQVAGIYDPKTDRLYLVTTGTARATDSTVLHEVVHAIQDKRYDLEAVVFRQRPNDGDGATAAQAVAEGDATEVQTRYIEERGAGAALEEFGNALSQLDGVPADQRSLPTFLQRSVEFPYIAGSEFIKRVRAAGGEAAVDRAFKNPPKSTLAIMKPELYLTGKDAPRRVVVRRPAAGFTRTMNTTFGAADLLALTGDSRIAEAWQGGRLAVDRNGANRTLTILIATSNPRALATGLRASLPESATVRVTGSIVTATNTAPVG